MPHTPVFPELAQRGIGGIQSRYNAVRERLDAARPDVLLFWACDHLNSFFLDNLPTFAVVTAPSVRGPNDDVPGVAVREIPVDDRLATYLLEELIGHGYDLARSSEIMVDHALVVPLLLVNHRRLPIVPLFINGMVPPLPSARRCLEIGRSVADAVRALPGNMRVAVLASGAFSLEVAGPRVDAERMWSVPCPEWAAQVAERLERGAYEEITGDATTSAIAEAGTVGGELLAWIAMMGAASGTGGFHVDYQTGEGHAFAVWTASGV